jgi:hypothetical protein
MIPQCAPALAELAPDNGAPLDEARKFQHAEIAKYREIITKAGIEHSNRSLGPDMPAHAAAIG